MKITTCVSALCAHLVLSLLVGDVLECEASDIFNHYLKRPKMVEFSRYHTDTRKWLQRLEIDSQADPASFLAQLRSQVEKVSGASLTNCERLLELADDSVECRVELVDFVISIYAQLERASAKSLGDFLNHFASKKFNQCATDLNAAIENQPRAEHEIDVFFKLRLQLDPNSSDATLLDAIKSSKRKFQLAFYQCLDLRSRFGNLLNILNLALAFGYGGQFEARLLKLNEYSRFCPSQLIIGDY